MSSTKKKIKSAAHPPTAEDPSNASKVLRFNITIPGGLYKEAEKIMTKYHFNGLSDLLQHLVREAAFKDTHSSAIPLNDAPTKNKES